MMAVEFLSGFTWGVDSTTISEGDGSTAPALAAASPTGTCFIELTFDQAMLEDSELLNPENYSIIQPATLAVLPVLRARQLSPTVVELLTQNQRGVFYEVEVNNVQDVFGNPIDTGSNSVLFGGSPPGFPETNDLRSFYGLESGMQADQTTSYAPILDPDPPEIRNELPLRNSKQVSRSTDITLSLLDTENLVVSSSIDIFVEGNLAYDGATGTFQAPYNGPGSSFMADTIDGYDGFTITVDKTVDYTSFKLVSVRAIAVDTIGNPLDETYTFRIEDFEPPIFSNRNPAAGATNVNQDTFVNLDIHDQGSGLDLDTLTATIDGFLAYDGASDTFFYPFNGPGSSFASQVVDGYDGYRLIVDKVVSYRSFGTVSVTVNVDDKEGN